MLRTQVCRREGRCSGAQGGQQRVGAGAKTGDILCVPQDLRQRGVAVIRPGEGRKLAGLGDRGKHTKGGRGSSSWEVRGRVILFRGSGRRRGGGQGTGGQQERRGRAARVPPGRQGRGEEGAAGDAGGPAPLSGETSQVVGRGGFQAPGRPLVQAGGTLPVPRNAPTCLRPKEAIPAPTLPRGLAASSDSPGSTYLQSPLSPASPLGGTRTGPQTRPRDRTEVRKPTRLEWPERQLKASGEGTCALQGSGGRAARWVASSGCGALLPGWELSQGGSEEGAVFDPARDVSLGGRAAVRYQVQQRAPSSLGPPK